MYPPWLNLTQSIVNSLRHRASPFHPSTQEWETPYEHNHEGLCSASFSCFRLLIEFLTSFWGLSCFLKQLISSGYPRDTSTLKVTVVSLFHYIICNQQFNLLLYCTNWTLGSSGCHFRIVLVNSQNLQTSSANLR